MTFLQKTSVTLHLTFISGDGGDGDGVVALNAAKPVTAG